MNHLTWEEAVRWFRAQPNNEGPVRDNYFDLPVRQAAERYARSEEFSEVARLLGEGKGRSILDLGAGNGIASFALARTGWRVTAVDPDPSDEVGIGAIRSLFEEAGLVISLVQECGEDMSLADASFDALHARQVFHHAVSLETMAKEAARVLRSGGVLLATREHVADDKEQLAIFRSNHPLHPLYGGESAYPVSRYVAAFEAASLHVIQVWGPAESILNFYPGSEDERQNVLQQMVTARCSGIDRWLTRVAKFREMQLKRVMSQNRTPGRLFSFLLEKS